MRFKEAKENFLRGWLSSDQEMARDIFCLLRVSYF